MNEARIKIIHNWAEELRELLRVQLKPSSDNLRKEYKLANDIVYAFRGRIVNEEPET